MLVYAGVRLLAGVRCEAHRSGLEKGPAADRAAVPVGQGLGRGPAVDDIREDEGAAGDLVWSNVIWRFSRSQTVLPATFAQANVLPEPLMRSDVIPATLVESTVLQPLGGEISDGTSLSPTACPRGGRISW